MRHGESNRATTVVCCGGAVRVVMFDILYGSVYLKLNVGKWVASVTYSLAIILITSRRLINLCSVNKHLAMFLCLVFLHIPEAIAAL